jgi:8-amino-7-oxononanoate synthase
LSVIVAREAPAARDTIATRWAEEDLRALSAQGLRRHLEPLDSPQGPMIRIGAEMLVNFSSNDYLGLARDPRLTDAAIAALHRHGLGAGASRLIVGDTTAHQSLERKLAAFKDAQAALLFNSGYAANVGVISALCGKDDVVFSDELNHASMIDGCKLSRAKIAVYPHCDVKRLDLLLRGIPGRRRLVCTDAIFSMDGDRAPLGDLVEVCRRHGAALLVDEAHATGVVGARGAGLCEELGVGGDVDLRVGTLGKALGAFGAYVATSAAVRDALIHRARSLVFSTALPPAVCAAAEAAVELVESEPALRAKLWRNIHRFTAGLREWGVPAEPHSAIFPVVLGPAGAALEVSKFLRARGLLVKPIRPPTVPEGTSRLRFAISAAHTDAQLDLAIATLKELEVPGA